jgi:hypothetical protein
MAVSQGWSDWVGGWFDWKGKILQIIASAGKILQIVASTGLSL